MPALIVDGLDAWYGGARILTTISLTVAPGEVVALLGRNGAGKTTTLRAIFGLIPSRTGRMLGRMQAFGHDLTRLPPHRIARLGLGYVPEDRRIFAELTVAENLEVGRQPPRADLPPWTPKHLYALFPNLAAIRDRTAGQLSGGEQQMLAVARTLMGNPRILLLDEPSEGLAPRMVQAIAGMIAHMRAAGVGVLLAEQTLTLAGTVADRAYIIEKGEIRHHTTMAALHTDETARRTWLAV